MDGTIILAKIFGIYLVVSGLSLIINREWYYKAMHEVANNNGVMMLIGLVTLILGAIAVSFHNHWTEDWRVVITLLCWLVLIGGVVRTLFPTFIQGMADKMRFKPNFINSASVFSIAVGCWLIYMGFFS